MKVSDFVLMEKVNEAIEWIKEEDNTTLNGVRKYFGDEVIPFLLESNRVLITNEGKVIYAYCSPKFKDKVNEGVEL